MVDRKCFKRKLSSSSIFNPGFYYSDNTFASGENIEDCNALASSRCWNCWDKIKPKKSISIPYNRTQEKKFVFHGKFCSLGCAKRYIISKWTHQSLTKMIWLNEAAREVFGIARPEFVPPSPPMESLKELGGPLSRNEFRQKIAKGKCLRSITYPFITFPMKLYEEEKGVEEASKTFAGNDLFALYVQKRAREQDGVKDACSHKLSENTQSKTSAKTKGPAITGNKPPKKKQNSIDDARQVHASLLPGQKSTTKHSKRRQQPKKRSRPVDDGNVSTAPPKKGKQLRRDSDPQTIVHKPTGACKTSNTNNQKGKRTRDVHTAASKSKKKLKEDPKSKRCKPSKAPSARNTLLNYVLKK